MGDIICTFAIWKDRDWYYRPLLRCNNWTCIYTWLLKHACVSPDAVRLMSMMSFTRMITPLSNLLCCYTWILFRLFHYLCRHHASLWHITSFVSKRFQTLDHVLLKSFWMLFRAWISHIAQVLCASTQKREYILMVYISFYLIGWLCGSSYSLLWLEEHQPAGSHF